jgi:hypothetical protein
LDPVPPQHHFDAMTTALTAFEKTSALCTLASTLQQEVDDAKDTIEEMPAEAGRMEVEYEDGKLYSETVHSEEIGYVKVEHRRELGKVRKQHRLEVNKVKEQLRQMTISRDAAVRSSAFFREVNSNLDKGMKEIKAEATLKIAKLEKKLEAKSKDARQKYKSLRKLERCVSRVLLRRRAVMGPLIRLLFRQYGILSVLACLATKSTSRRMPSSRKRKGIHRHEEVARGLGECSGPALRHPMLRPKCSYPRSPYKSQGPAEVHQQAN